MNNVGPFIPKSHELLLNIIAVALNHRDFYIRQNLYSLIFFVNFFLFDKCVIVFLHSNSTVDSASFSSSQRVIINPDTRWLSDFVESEKAYTMLDNTSTIAPNTLQKMVAILADDVELTSEHLSNAGATALPLTGLIVWRALIAKSDNAKSGRQILMTGIDGGVTVMMLFFVIAMNYNFYVTSSSIEKINRAKNLDEKDDVVYINKG